MPRQLAPADARRLVRKGWDRASWFYRGDDRATDVFHHTAAEHRRWLSPILREVTRGARVLDLGCGCGTPTARLLSGRLRVTGVDISRVQLRRARSLVPGAAFVRADMTALAFPPATFDAVVCLYSLIHVPVAEQRPLLARIRDWLRPAGWFIVVTGHDAFEGVEGDWLGSGAPMYWSHADAPTYRRWLTASGFDVVDQLFIPEEAAGHELFRCRARGSQGADRESGSALPHNPHGRRTTRGGRSPVSAPPRQIALGVRSDHGRSTSPIPVVEDREGAAHGRSGPGP